MPLTDLPLDQLHEYRPEVAEPADFDEFWSTTLAESRAADRGFDLAFSPSPLTEIVVDDLTFSGFGGDPVRAWVTHPARATGPLPTVVEYIGYGGGRGEPGERLHWAASGFTHVLMDTRGQGSSWGTGGHTADPHGAGAAAPGMMTRGIEDPATYYFRRLYTDAVRVIDVVRGFPFVDPARIAVTGISQGGGLAIVAAALVPDVVAVMPNVPFLSHFRRAVDLTPAGPFTEVTRYLATHRDRAASVFETLSYFDGVNFARRIEVPALFSVALMDDVVIPSTVFAAFNHVASPNRSIEVYPFNGHEGGELHQWAKQVDWLRALIE